MTLKLKSKKTGKTLVITPRPKDKLLTPKERKRLA